MANEHPFQMLFETLGRVPTAHAESVNRQAYETLHDVLSVPVEKPGRCILLRAPRAGHGKTHLLSRIQHHLAASHEFIPLHAAFGCQIDASTVIDDSLRRLLRPLPASGGLCVLDLVARKLFASALQPLVGSGEVPCQDREGALTALRTRPVETFDFHHPNAVTAHWARENFEVLGQRLSMELAQRCGLPVREVSFWVEVLFRFAATPVENPVRLKALAEAVHSGSAADGVVMERLEALLGLIAQLMRVVLVADDLEGFSTDETAALRLAAFLGSLRQSVERLDVILSLNQDIWQNAFLPRLSGGLADRLSEVVVELSPLTDDEMVALLESRVPGLGSRVLSKVDRDSAGTHARGLVRAAGVAWLRASAMDSTPAAATPAPVVPAVVSPVVPVAPPPSAEEITPIQAPVATVLEAPPVFEAPAAPVFEAPAAPVVESPPVRSPAPEPVVPAAVAERVPDPTLAIAFLAASEPKVSQETSWPEPVFSPPSEAPAPPPVVNSPFVPSPAVAEVVVAEPFAAAAPVQDAPVFEPQASVPADAMKESQPLFAPAAPADTPAAAGFESPPAAGNPFARPGSGLGTFQPGDPTAARSVPVFSDTPQPIAPPEPVTVASTFQPVPESAPAPFQAAPEPSLQPAFQAAPGPAAQPAFQAVPETPAFQAAAEVLPASTAQDGAGETKVPDTDRVDDLLRQFRERYGRGSL